jgi:23S rRNA (guanosine2251-2'-O)-methyltransferase
MKRRFFVNPKHSDRAVGVRQHVYGVHAVAARLRTDPPQVTQLHVHTDPSARLTALAADAARRGVPVSWESSAVLRELCGTNQHQGVVAAVPPFPYRQFEDALGRQPDRILILDQLQDPHNLGALLRTAEAAGFRVVVLPKDGAVGVTAVVEKASAGAAIRLAVARVVNVARALRRLKGAGYWVVGLAPRAAADLYGFEPRPPIVLVIGAERGLRPLVRETCDQLLSIPMEGDAESLNVSVAGAVAMYELSRRLRAVS